VALTHRKLQIWLCCIAAVNGAVFSLFGIVQQLTYNEKIYWSVPLRFGGSPFAAFVNRNHGGGYLNHCVAASLAVLIWSMTRLHGDGNDQEDLGGAYEWETPVQRWGYGFIANLDAFSLICVTMAVSIAAGVVCSLSRGAILALICATFVTAFFVVRIRGASSVAAVATVVLCIGIGMAVWLGRGELLKGRLTETVVETGGNSRIDHWQDVLSACGDYWLTGSGLGTYRYAYRPYETQPYSGWFFHAENQYLEALVEAGVVGLVLMLFTIIAVFVGTIRLLKQKNDSFAFAIGIAGLFALASQVVHSFFDFGLYMPSNAILFAAIMGMACSTVPANDTADNKWVRQYGVPVRVGYAIVLLTATLWLVFVGLEILQTAQVEKAVEESRKLDSSAVRQLDRVQSCIDRLEGTLRRQPFGNAEARFRLAELHVLAYRIRVVEQMATRNGLDREQLWAVTTPLALHQRAFEVARMDPKLADRLRNQSYVRENLGAAVGCLEQALQGCPIINKVPLALAELFVASLEGNSDEPYIQHAIRLAPYDPDVLFRCGLLDLQAGRVSQGQSKWKKCLALSSDYVEDILRLAPQFFDEAAVVQQLVPDAPDRMVEIARLLSSREQQRGLAKRAREVLEVSSQKKAEEWYLVGSIGKLLNDLPAAIDGFTKAVEEEPTNNVWRFELATLLEACGQTTEARQHARVLLRNAPRMVKYRELMKRLNRSSATDG
ncbi:MAG: O-antigen ligase family protein, partial [Planctomycetota bacterium]